MHNGERSTIERTFALIAMCALVLVITSASLDATVLLPADFLEMVDGSQIIVHGRVTDVRSQDTAGRQTIQSVITVAVLDPLKGQAGGSVVFRIPGGQIGRYRRFMIGAPVFNQGDEVVLFLSGRAPSMPMPFGLSQGVYRVMRDADGRVLVTPPPVLARGLGAERVVRGDPARRALPIEAFAREVRSAVERAR